MPTLVLYFLISVSFPPGDPFLERIESFGEKTSRDLRYIFSNGAAGEHVLSDYGVNLSQKREIAVAENFAEPHRGLIGRRLVFRPLEDGLGLLEAVDLHLAVREANVEVHGDEIAARCDLLKVVHHLSGNFWPGRPMRGGGIKSDHTYELLNNFLTNKRIFSFALDGLKGESKKTKMAWPKKTHKDIPKIKQQKPCEKRDNESDEWRQRQHGDRGRLPARRGKYEYEISRNIDDNRIRTPYLNPTLILMYLLVNGCGCLLPLPASPSGLDSGVK